MKRITNRLSFKILSRMIMINLIIYIVIFGWLASSLIIPSLKNTGITFTDLFKSELELEKYNKFEDNIMVQADTLSNLTANKIKNGLRLLFPAPNFNYSNMPDIDYPYPSIDEVLKINEQKASEGIKQGLRHLEESEKNNSDIIKQILSSGNN